VATKKKPAKTTKKKATTKKKKTNTDKPSKILSLSGETVSSDTERMAELRARLSPTDRDNYDKICDAIQISMDTQRLSVMPQLLQMKADIEKRYEQSDDDRVIITWDDAALSEAVSGA